MGGTKGSWGKKEQTVEERLVLHVHTKVVTVEGVISQPVLPVSYGGGSGSVKK